MTLLDLIIEVVNDPPEGCVLWENNTTGRKVKYGQVKCEGEAWQTHRLALTLYSGEYHHDMHAAHDPVTCTSSLCYNPTHLRWATPKENIHDKRITNTQARGETQGAAKLTEVDVLAIRADDRIHHIIAAEYGVSRGCVSHIKRRFTWAHVPDQDLEQTRPKPTNQTKGIQK